MHTKEVKQLYYSKIPNSLFYSDNETIFKVVDNEKIIIVLDYLYLHLNMMNKTSFTIEDIILSYGLRLNDNKDGINNQIIDIINLLKNLNIITFQSNISKFKLKQFYKCNLNINYENNFFILKNEEIIKILKLKRKNKFKILLYYCYLKSRMYNSGSTLPIYAVGGKASVCYPSYELINKDINLASDTVNKYNTILSDLDLIRYDNAGNYIDKVTGENKTSTNTYAIFKPDGSHEYEIKEAIKAYKLDPNKKFIKKKITKRTRSDTGFIVQMNIKIKKGVKLTSKQQKRYDDIIKRTGDYI